MDLPILMLTPPRRPRVDLLISRSSARLVDTAYKMCVFFKRAPYSRKNESIWTPRELLKIVSIYNIHIKLWGGWACCSLFHFLCGAVIKLILNGGFGRRQHNKNNDEFVLRVPRCGWYEKNNQDVPRVRRYDRLWRLFRCNEEN